MKQKVFKFNFSKNDNLLNFYVNSTNKIVINNKELANMGGDIDSFFSHLDKVVKI